MRPAALEHPRVAPSLLAADFARLGAVVAEVTDAGARVIHVDVMDGHFVPPLTMGPLVVSALREQLDAAGVLIDVHLMVERPERQVADFARAGADIITLHAEATPHLHYALAQVREHGVAAGLAVCPGTPIAVYTELAETIDVALCMTVNPGWGGQAFLDTSISKLERMRTLLGAEVSLAVDGGIEPETASRCRGVGATLFVAGSGVFGEPDPGGAYAALAAVVGDPRR